MTSLMLKKVIEEVNQLDFDDQLDLILYLKNKTEKFNKNTIINNDFISQNDDILGGELCIKGTRISVESVLENLASGQTKEQLIASYPSLSLDAIEGAIEFAQSLDNDHYLRKLFDSFIQKY
ncbi:DUF433 domain-containing protein [Cyanobacterium sp. Dongsha4]|uniref:DUF433 domain-containing protein n=1 Tax=Cyanobacterium sp. DS4 TaxID=2878255 RepID=UPI002E81439F|nr:DUF433 domain-containing protein [Cyanobacterium sp. Dongsha4]WVL00023.1 DUF433 domain-containing protein [Cyanobacterium sp. Dongsha4]